MGCAFKPSPWQITDKNSLLTTFITTVDFPFAPDEESSIGSIFYDMEREQLFIRTSVFKLRPNYIPNIDLNSGRNEYYYLDTDNKTVEKSAPHEDLIRIFSYNSESLFIGRSNKATEISKQPFGNFELIASNNRTFAFPRLVWNWPPGTGTSWKRSHNGTMKIELKDADKTDFIFSISEKYGGRSSFYSATFTPDGLYAIVQPVKPSSRRRDLTKRDSRRDTLMVLGKLPVNKSKSEINAIVKEKLLERSKELVLPFSL